MATRIFEIALSLTPKEDGDEPDKLDEMMAYAKWKAADISKCLKQGIPVRPGGATTQHHAPMLL